MINLAQEIKICNGIIASSGHNTGTDSEVIDLANAHMVYIVVSLRQTANGAEITPQRDDAEGTGLIALVNTVPIWENEALATDDVLVRLDNAVARTTTNTPGNKLVVFQIDPARLGDHTGGDNLPCNRLAVNIDTAEAADDVNVLFFVVPRYKQATVPEMRV